MWESTIPKISGVLVIVKTIFIRSRYMKPESTVLYFREGTSDKEYHAILAAMGAGWVVKYAHGRRGGTLNTGTKTGSPVEYAEAKKIYDRLVSEKTKKGYTPSESGVAYTGTVSELRDTGFRPQLLNDIEESEAERYITDDRYLAQEKHDGRRRGLVKKDEKADGANKKGLSVGIPEALEKEVLGLQGDNTIDGEDLGEIVQVFDMLKVGGADIRAEGYQDRYKRLKTLITSGKCRLMRVVETAWTTEEKRALFERLKKEGAEGIVFKLKDAPYTPGCPASGGPQLKCKFYASTAFIVSKANKGKRSVAIVMISSGAEVPVGNVTIPSNKDIPAENAIVEVKYLYAYRKDTGGGTLYQPVYIGPRDDVDREECDVKKLKFKKQGVSDDDDA